MLLMPNDKLDGPNSGRFRSVCVHNIRSAHRAPHWPSGPLRALLGVILRCSGDFPQTPASDHRRCQFARTALCPARHLRAPHTASPEQRQVESASENHGARNLQMTPSVELERPTTDRCCALYAHNDPSANNASHQLSRPPQALVRQHQPPQPQPHSPIHIPPTNQSQGP